MALPWWQHHKHCRESWLLWAPAQRKRATMLYFANVYLFIYFFGRLVLRPWWTEVRESITRGGPRVSLEKLLLGFFPGHPYTTGWAIKWRNLAYFQTPPANFLLSRPNAAEYCNSEKKLVKHRWFLYNLRHVWWTLAYKPLRSTRHKILKKTNDIGE